MSLCLQPGGLRSAGPSPRPRWAYPGPAPHRPSSTLFQVLFRLWHLSSSSDFAVLGGPAVSGEGWLPPSEVEPDSREEARRS